MSTEYYVYIGAYVEAKNKSIEVDKFIKSCCNIDATSNSKYCTECGKELVPFKVDIITKEKIDNQNIFNDEMTDSLYLIYKEFACNEQREKQVDIFISNSDAGCLKDVDDDSMSLEITENDRIRYTRDFLVAYQDEILVLKNHYGDDNISIKFGVVTSYR